MEEEKSITKKELEVVLEEKFTKQNEDIKNMFIQQTGIVVEQLDHNFKLALESTLGSTEERLKDVFKDNFHSVGEQLDDKVSHEECHKNMAKLQFDKV